MKLLNMTMRELVEKFYEKDTPWWLYDPTITLLNEDGGYHFRMSPPTHQPYSGHIFLPDVTIDDVYKNCMERERTKSGVELDTLMLKAEGILIADQEISPLILALFIIFHEEGHWRHFVKEYKSVGKTGEEFNKDMMNAKELLGIPELMKSFKQDNSLSAELQSIYNDSPYEKIANEYAIIKLKQLKQDGFI